VRPAAGIRRFDAVLPRLGCCRAVWPLLPVRNRGDREMRAFRLVTAAMLALSVGACSYVYPDCDSTESRTMITTEANKLEPLMSRKLTVKEIKDIKETARDDTAKSKTCSGTIILSDDASYELKFTIAPNKDDESRFQLNFEF
jgi:hypothetical protein